DLYWASRGGGGGNFGVATSFTLATHPAASVSLFTVHWPWAAASQVLGGWLDWAPFAPDALWSNCLLLTSPGTTGPPSVKVTGVFGGTTGALSGLLAGLLAAVGTSPTSQTLSSTSYLGAMMIEAGCGGLSVAQCHLPSQNRAGLLTRSSFGAKSSFVNVALPNAGLAAATSAVNALQAMPGASGGLNIDSWGGAINRVPAGSTAFVHRSSLASIQYSASWAVNASASTVAANQAWLASAAASMAPYVSSEAYQNYIDPTLLGWETDYYGSNLARLMAVKATYDPDQVFRFAQSIPPA
ncbi:MAG: BBE domain-containing protein, partial [Acidimicrobiales bacterium]